MLDELVKGLYAIAKGGQGSGPQAATEHANQLSSIAQATGTKEAHSNAKAAHLKAQDVRSDAAKATSGKESEKHKANADVHGLAAQFHGMAR